jgi:soluble lytic murein transglycosylase-like protein
LRLLWRKAVFRSLFARWRHSNNSDISGGKQVEEAIAPQRDFACRRQTRADRPDKSHLNKLPLSSLRKVLPLALITGTAYSNDAWAFCWNEAGTRYRVSAALLQSIGQHESGLRATAINRNQNGTVDVGLMQINSVHFKELQSYGISPNALWDPCTNVMVGAFLLARSIQKYGNTWEAVGGYHSRTPDLKERYAKKVYGVFAELNQPSRGAVRDRPVKR